MILQYETAPGVLAHPEAAEQSNSQTEFCYPSPHSVKGRTLADLLRGHRLTHMDIWERHGSSRAAHHVLMLRKAGWPVITHEIEVPTSDGRIASIAEYSLSQDAIGRAGERGLRYIGECALVSVERGSM
jgi:hypothetical protein